MSDVNPYQAPQPSSGGPDREEPRRASRGLSIVVAILTQGLPGAGLLVLGRARLARIWLVAGLGVYLLSILQLAAWLTVLGLSLCLLLWFSGFVATCVVKPGAAPRRAGVLAVSLIVGTLAIAVGVRVFVCEAFQIPAGSMIPTLLIGDHIFVKKYRKTPVRGDVIVFRYPLEPSTDYIKRVVALPGETVAIRDNVLVIDGRSMATRALEQPCRWEGRPCGAFEESTGSRSYVVVHDPERRAEFGPVTVPPGSYFVMGDNRDHSNDSRVWGTVRADLVKGVASTVWYSSDPHEGTVRWGRVGTPIR